MILRACVVCAKPGPESYCREHRPAPWGSKRRERMGISGGAWETLRHKVIARDMECCFLCGRVGGELEVDHLVEVAAGGSNSLANLATCHKTCHARRHREPEWAAERVAMALEVLAR